MTIRSGLRFDFGPRRLTRIKRSGEGYLQGDAAVARVGILSYRLADGSIRREFVPEETLFNADSMNSLKMKPITNAHPPEHVLDSSSVKRRTVGFTGENVNKDDNVFLVSSLVITDNSAIQEAEGGRRQLSPGYRAEIELRSGKHDGQRYDAVQTRRTYNHLALVDAARGGSELQLHLDGTDDDQFFVTDSGIRVDGIEFNEDRVLTHRARQELPDSAFAFVRTVNGKKIRKFPIPDAAHVRNALARLPQSNLSPEEKAAVKRKLIAAAKKFDIEVSQDGSVLDSDVDDYNYSDSEMSFITHSKERRMKTVTINGLDYEAAPEVANHLDTVVKERDEARAKLDTVTAERDTHKAKVDELEKVDHKDEIAKAVKTRLDLERAAVTHLDEETQKKLDSMEDKEIKSAVILKAFPNATDQLKDASDTYLDARFDSALDVLKDKKGDDKTRNDTMAKQRQAAKSGDAKKTSDDKDDALDQDKARERMQDRMTHPEKYNEDGTEKK